MSEYVLEREQVVPGPVDDVFAFFAQARNLERITPPWLRFEVLTPEPIAMRAGTLIEYRLRVRGVPLRQVSRIEEWKSGRRFVDLRRDLERIFDYRRAAVERLLAQPVATRGSVIDT